MFRSSFHSYRSGSSAGSHASDGSVMFTPSFHRHRSGSSAGSHASGGTGDFTFGNYQINDDFFSPASERNSSIFLKAQAAWKGLFSRSPASSQTNFSERASITSRAFVRPKKEGSGKVIDQLSFIYEWNLGSNRAPLIIKTCRGENVKTIKLLVDRKDEITDQPISELGGFSERQLLLFELWKLTLINYTEFHRLYQTVFTKFSCSEGPFPEHYLVPKVWQGVRLCYFTPEVAKCLSTKILPDKEDTLKIDRSQNAIMPLWLIVLSLSGWSESPELWDLCKDYLGESFLMGSNKGYFEAGGKSGYAEYCLSAAEWLVMRGLLSDHWDILIKHFPCLKIIRSTPLPVHEDIPKKFHGLKPLTAALMLLNEKAIASLTAMDSEIDSKAIALLVAKDGASVVSHLVHRYPLYLQQILPWIGPEKIGEGDHKHLTAWEVIFFELLIKGERSDNLEAMKPFFNGPYNERFTDLFSKTLPNLRNLPFGWKGLTFGTVLSRLEQAQ